MIYAVNKRTKEHRRIAWNDENMDDEWIAVQATPDGWIEWRGGECPLPDGDGRCEIRDRMGRELRATPRKVSWGHVGNAFDAIAYRPILPAVPSEAQAPERDGPQDGLPPVGVEVQSSEGIALIKGYYGSQVWYQRQSGGDVVQMIEKAGFRPIRSEEDRAVDALSRAMKDAHAEGIDILEDRACCRVVYNAIRDGKVPGVKLTGGE